MAEKVKITAEQAGAIEYVLDPNGRDLTQEEVIQQHSSASQSWSMKASPLRVLTLLQIVDALRIGYEVEPEYKTRDWVAYDSASKGLIVCKVEQVNEMSVDTDYIGSNGVKQNFDKEGIRHAAPEEIKAEQERRVWAKIGREPGDIRDGDVGVMNNIMVTRITDIEMIKECYEQKCLLGIYPVESFIEFGAKQMPNWTNNGGIYMVPRPNKVDKQQIKRDMDLLEARLQEAEAAMAAREGMTA